MSTPLALDERCAAIPGEDVLYVLTPRDLHEVRGRGVDRLHRRLRPYLEGRYGEEELVGAVPPSRRGAVRRYLGRLRDLGVLREGAPEPEPGRHRVRFVGPEEAAELLLLPWGAEGGPEPLTAVVVEGEAAAADGEALRERAAYGRWLLRNAEEVRPPEERFRLFRLDGATGSLERLVSVGGGPDRDAGSVPEQLGIVRPAAVEQVPLVVATAAHPLFGPRVTGYGLSDRTVRAEVLRRLLARLLAPEAASSPGTAVAPSPLEIELRRLDREAERRALRDGGVRWEEADLLAPGSDHPAVAYLQEVLRLRAPSLRGRRGRTADGASVWAAGELRACSHLPERALAELLLREVWRRYYPGGAPAEAGGEEAVPVLDLDDFVTGEELRRLLRERSGASRRRSRPPGAPRDGSRRLSLWGVTLYLEEGADGDEDHLRRRAVG